MRTMTWPGLCVVLLVTFVHVESQQQPNLVFREPPRAVTGTSYCSLLNCCRGRSDSCSLPYFDTICYCDEFCNRTSASDCCPDYRPVCLGLPPPNEPTPLPQPPETEPSAVGKVRVQQQLGTEVVPLLRFVVTSGGGEDMHKFTLQVHGNGPRREFPPTARGMAASTTGRTIQAGPQSGSTATNVGQEARPSLASAGVKSDSWDWSTNLGCRELTRTDVRQKGANRETLRFNETLEETRTLTRLGLICSELAKQYWSSHIVIRDRKHLAETQQICYTGGKRLSPEPRIPNLQADAMGQGDFVSAACIHLPPVFNVRFDPRITFCGRIVGRPLDTGDKWIQAANLKSPLPHRICLEITVCPLSPLTRSPHVSPSVCQPTQAGSYEFRCQENPCLLRPTMLEAINQGDYGWQAEAYPFLYGLTLDQGLQYKLGTDPVPESVHAMRGIQVSIRDNIPEFFDARSRWPGLIQDVRDQGNCGASWAFSTTAVLADRLAIQSRGTMTATLSPQNLLSCNTNRQRGCQGGRLDRAWWFLRKKGVTTDACYPYSSGSSAQAGQCAVPRSNGRPYPCPSNNGETTMKYQSSPAYKISSREEDIMKEIMTNGPVQATMEVKPDLFSYRSGVYRHTELAQGEPPEYRRRGWHSVRILGCGDVKSISGTNQVLDGGEFLGQTVGEEGYFRIVRGENECQIESFVLGVWGKVNPMVINNRVTSLVTKVTHT
ncbi:Tubulointerstitial nephritis antigen-like [Branchiostoma belcheri]|nr:Tubulointerstitial nephritis antigen-like [Branchiostoma belcheri]